MRHERRRYAEEDHARGEEGSEKTEGEGAQRQTEEEDKDGEHEEERPSKGGCNYNDDDDKEEAEEEEEEEDDDDNEDGEEEGGDEDDDEVHDEEALARPSDLRNPRVFYDAPHHFDFLRSTDLPCFFLNKFGAQTDSTLKIWAGKKCKSLILIE
ncbi:hypothetical protein THAOC_28936 [Thalassiosira oceanica]|uniref:Uncharacterized protein n=1 Tax=Thalassiosira oceanica TaxID=159749 RepID=K0RDP7_THAOC|nr:hypothetical protein THAOC_28936 [Thalassiosira oceanica]|eukprot:EJK51853.1 hypothetical protein THAOC_28936 [Thalassiosira oceanica]